MKDNDYEKNIKEMRKIIDSSKTEETNSYSVVLTNKQIPFTSQDVIMADDIPSLSAAVALSSVINNHPNYKGQIAVIQYKNLNNYSNEKIKEKIINEVKQNNLDNFAVFHNNLLILNNDTLSKINNPVPTDFTPALPFGVTPKELQQEETTRLETIKNINSKNLVEIVSNSKQFDNLSFITYDIVSDKMPFPIASGLYLAESANIITNAILEGNAINSEVVMNALKEDHKYSSTVKQHLSELHILLKRNKQMTKEEIAEEAAIKSLAEIEQMIDRMKRIETKI